MNKYDVMKYCSARYLTDDLPSMKEDEAKKFCEDHKCSAYECWYGNEIYNEIIMESLVMAQWLKSHGVEVTDDTGDAFDYNYEEA